MGLFKNLFVREYSEEWFHTPKAEKDFNERVSTFMAYWKDMKKNIAEYEKNKDLLDESDNHFEEDFLKELQENQRLNESYNNSCRFLRLFCSEVASSFHLNSKNHLAHLLLLQSADMQADNAHVLGYKLAPVISDSNPLIRFIKKFKIDVPDEETEKYIIDLCYHDEINVDDERVYNPDLYSSRIFKLNKAKIDELVQMQKENR